MYNVNVYRYDPEQPWYVGKTSTERPYHFKDLLGVKVLFSTFEKRLLQ
jgi:hypothetical protein